MTIRIDDDWQCHRQRLRITDSRRSTVTTWPSIHKKLRTPVTSVQCKVAVVAGQGVWPGVADPIWVRVFHDWRRP